MKAYRAVDIELCTLFSLILYGGEWSASCAGPPPPGEGTPLGNRQANYPHICRNDAYKTCIKNSVLVGYDATSLGNWLPVFQNHCFALKHLELIISDAALHLSSMEASAMPLQ
jgi:hypothetical protein